MGFDILLPEGLTMANADGTYTEAFEAWVRSVMAGDMKLEFPPTTDHDDEDGS